MNFLKYYNLIQQGNYATIMMIYDACGICLSRNNSLHNKSGTRHLVNQHKYLNVTNEVTTGSTAYKANTRKHFENKDRRSHDVKKALEPAFASTL